MVRPKLFLQLRAFFMPYLSSMHNLYEEMEVTI